MDIRITYCAASGYLPHASGLAGAIKKEFGISPNLRPGHGGIFEVVVDGFVEYTNAGASGVLPDQQDILRRVRGRRPALRLREEQSRAAREKAGGSAAAIPEPVTKPRAVGVDFQYVEIGSCARCRATERNLNEALALLRPVLELAGVQLDLRKTSIASEEQARALGFVSSPTILVGGRDIAGEVKESLCETCGECVGEDVYCRVWQYEGREHDSAPVPLIVDAILSEAYAGGRRPVPESPLVDKFPENLAQLFMALSVNK